MAKINWLLTIGLILRLVILVSVNSHPDVGNHLDWGNRFWEYGAKNFYTGQTWSVSAPNQPFNTIYIFALLASLKNSLFSTVLFVNQNMPSFPSKLVWLFETNLHVWLVKLPSILTDLGLAWIIFSIVYQYKPKQSLLASAIFLFNPVVIYNSTVWGQTDSLINFFCLLGLWQTFNKNFFWGAFFFLLSFTFKMSLLIYLPIYLILLYRQKNSWLKNISNHLLILIVFLIQTLPFSLGKNIFSWPLNLYLYTILGNQGNMLNGNAYNLWFINLGADITRQSSPSQILLGVIIFLFFIIPILISFAKSKLTFTSLVYTCFLISFSSFLFLTNMHERYLYPIFPLLPLLFVLLPKTFTLIKIACLSLIHWLNLYQLWYYPHLPYLKSLIEANNYLAGKFLTLALFLFYSHFLINYYQSETKK